MLTNDYQIIAAFRIDFLYEKGNDLRLEKEGRMPKNFESRPENWRRLQA